MESVWPNYSERAVSVKNNHLSTFVHHKNAMFEYYIPRHQPPDSRRGPITPPFPSIYGSELIQAKRNRRGRYGGMAARTAIDMGSTSFSSPKDRPVWRNNTWRSTKESRSSYYWHR